jgi:uncharacterized membrane protein
MSEPYNRFTGQSIERLTALSDGLFAVAMTLLVLDLRVPVLAAGLSSEHGLWAALLKLGPSFAAYLLSFTLLGTFWLAQHTLLGILGRCDRTLTWINVGFLFVVSLLPFSAALLAHYTFRRRIVLAQSGYTLAALVCLLSTQASVIALAVVQLYYIVSPRLPRIQRERA